jgi:2-polyprenyl-6-methoxyphenol hydroxylase-like FAD-dependent oxidoreductase
VVIVGAGPAGLLLAYLLVTNGVSVRVLERHPDFAREFRGEGIQPSVVRLLERLGFLPHLLERGIALRARRAVIHADGRPVVTLGGPEDDGRDFGLVVFQEGFLQVLHDACGRYPHYRLDFGASVTRPITEEGRVTALLARRGGVEERVEGGFFVVTAGRGTPLRKQVGAEVETLESSFNIYWLRFDLPDDPSLIPDGFRAYLGDDALFVLYRTYDRRIQMAWGKRWEDRATLRDPALLRARLLADVPAAYRPMVEAQFGEHTERQMLKVTTDRLRRWHAAGLLFLGDAAHTMSPVAGQGINLAMRDSVVAANHLLRARREGRPWDDALRQRIEEERRPEVEAMQRFQVLLGRLMLGAPAWQRRVVFRWLMPLLSALGVRQRYVRRVQHGVTRVEPWYPVTLNQARGAPVPGLPGPRVDRPPSLPGVSPSASAIGDARARRGRGGGRGGQGRGS